MLRIHDEPVDVVCSAGAPSQFLLRGRLHVVRAVLAHWVEPSGWSWVAPPGGPAQVTGGRPVEGAGVSGRAVGAAVQDESAERSVDQQASRAGSAGARRRPVIGPHLVRSAMSGPGAEVGTRAVWRVEASAGRSAPLNAFDLCHVEAPSRWTVSQVEE